MAKQLQLRRGTTAENDAFTGAIGEVTVDTTLKQLRVHDGETQGGIKVANVAEVVDDLATKQDTSNLVTAVSSASTDTQYPSAKLLYDALATKADVSALANKADKATTLAGYGITDATKTDLSNLTSVGKNITNWSSNVTNCITEIPQDIQLELSAGVLTLKAGSKVCVPSGVDVFTTITIANDVTWQPGGGTAEQLVVCYNSTTGDIIYRYLSEVYSGSAHPIAVPNMFWYDTAHNAVEYTTDSGSTWTGGLSFPICLVTANANQEVISVDQVFNGFGFIGSAVFMYPGVKGLIPNGRNADGTLNNQVVTTSSVKVYNAISYGYGLTYLIQSTGSITASNTDCYSVGAKPASYVGGLYGTWYDTESNKIYYTSDGGNTWTQVYMVMFGSSYITNSGQLDWLNTKEPFQTLDYSDSNYIAHCAMPGDRYIDLTLGANYTSYTMPDDGYLFLYKSADAANQYITISNNATDMAIHQWVPASGGGCAGYLPVKKGDSIMITYTAGGAVVYFRFIYANGATKEF